MAESPNNDYGYGIINTVNAMYYENQLRSNEPELSPDSFNLSMFPNPFNSSIKIHITGNKIDFIKINVFNLNGVLIKNIYEKNINENFFEIDWAPSHHGSGIYLIRINVDNEIFHRKVSYIK